MWEINNYTPFAAERTWVRDMNGAEVWLVAVKAIFDISNDGILSLAEEQEPVHIAPQLRDDSENPSLLFDTDLPHKKTNTDVLVEGFAYAPNGNPVTRMEVQLSAGNINKRLLVVGDRFWQQSVIGLSLSQPKPFIKMPVIYERAFGGVDELSENSKERGWEPCNPVGAGFAMKSEHLVGKAAPNIEDPNNPVKSWGDRPTPMCFGPIAGHWSPRVELAGTYDEEWEKNRQPLLAKDFDERFFQSAPPDQQANGYFKGGEQIALQNMTPNGWLRFRLPRLSFYIKTNFFDGSSEIHRAVMHTVVIKPEFPKVEVVWHSHLPCHHKVNDLSNTTIRLKERVFSRDDKKIFMHVV